MGTSRNDRSPSQPRWRPVFAAIGKKNIPAEQQLSEIWRAALASRGDLLQSELQGKSLTHAMALIADRTPVARALKEFDQVRRDTGESGFLLDLGRRSLARCAATA